jgi:hypothetical protein
VSLLHIIGSDSDASRATDLLADEVFTNGHNWISVQIVCEVFHYSFIFLELGCLQLASTLLLHAINAQLCGFLIW